MCEKASDLDGDLAWGWTAKGTSIWTAHRLGLSAGLKCLKAHRVVVFVRRLSGRGMSLRVCCPALRCRRWRASTGRRAGRFTIGVAVFDGAANWLRANLRQRASRRWWWKGRWRKARSGGEAGDCDRRRGADGRGDRREAAVSGDPRGAGVTMIAPGADLKIYIATQPIDFRCDHVGLRRRCRRCFISTPSMVRPSCSDRNERICWCTSASRAASSCGPGLPTA